MDILSGVTPLIVDVRQTGSGPYVSLLALAVIVPCCMYDPLDFSGGK